MRNCIGVDVPLEVRVRRPQEIEDTRRPRLGRAPGP